MGRLRHSALLGLAFTAVISLGMAFLPGFVAHAETAYRYWSFWIVEQDAWSYALVGPASVAVDDGDVFAWRFGIARSGKTDGLKPDLAPNEVRTRACEDEPVDPGQARVAIVLDYGSPEDAPPGETPPASSIECAQVAAGSTGAQALSAIATIRAEGGLICAFDGYPASECAPVISVDDEPSPPPDDVNPDHGGTTNSSDPPAAQAGGSSLGSIEDGSSSGFTTILLAGAVVLTVFIALALVATRKRRPR